jgi:hypothetical protein
MRIDTIKCSDLAIGLLFRRSTKLQGLDDKGIFIVFHGKNNASSGLVWKSISIHLIYYLSIFPLYAFKWAALLAVTVRVQPQTGLGSPISLLSQAIWMSSDEINFEYHNSICSDPSP